MKSLCKLKRYEYYRRLSITNDFTINEQKKIKEMNDKAKKMNSGNEGDLIDFKWSVRGSPRTKLRFIKKISENTKTFSIVNHNPQQKKLELPNLL